MMKVLFVCTGNSCRSPMAGALAEKIFAEHGVEAEILTRGISVLIALEASENAIVAMKKRGLDLTNHVTRQIAIEDMKTSDLILTMTKRHTDYLKIQMPEIAHKIYPLYTFATGEARDVHDPFGGDPSVYELCADELSKLIKKVAKRLANQPETIQVPEVKTLAIGSDHAGYELKQHIIQYLKETQISWEDVGTHTQEATDYPKYAKAVSQAVLDRTCIKGLLICGTGIGISIAANRNPGIRAALCHDVFSAKSSRLHNDANVLVLGGRVVGVGHALEILQAFLSTPFSNDIRHQRRIQQIDQE